MDIQDLRIFARVAALQNLSAVGAELRLTPGTISKRLQALEEELKARLFDRTTRSIRITEEGAKFLERTERILAEFEDAVAAVGASTERPAGRLKISAPVCLSRRLVAPAVIGFLEAYPEIEVRVDVSDRIVNLQEDGYDAAIRTGTLPDSALKAKRLAVDRMILVAAPCYLERRPAPTAPGDLASHDCLLQDESRAWTMLSAGEPTSVRVTGRLQSDNGEVLHAAALAGLGILRASELGVADDIAAGRLVRVLPDCTMASNAGVWAVYPSARFVPPRLRVFLDHLAQCCRELLPLDAVLNDNRKPPAAASPVIGSPPPTKPPPLPSKSRFKGSTSSRPL